MRIANRKSAFTLIEMIVVITIIVIAMTLAVPAIRSLTGSRSQEAAQNVLTTALGSVRAEAMALQRVEGIMFFLDTSSDRVQCVAVMETPAQPATDHVGVTYLDLVPDKDPISLPTGIWCWTIKDQPTVGGFVQPILPRYRHLGFNLYSSAGVGDFTTANPPTINVPGGVILFDSTGRLTVKTYGLRLVTGTPATPTQLATFIYPNQNPSALTLQNWPSSSANPFYLNSQIGLCLFDRETFLSATDQNGNNFTPFNNSGGGNNISDWLDTNTTPIFINRYDATLMRAE
jgi:prepilin-type N-terminal cleavage/methylation domain-containing protein